jgi:hypothetical protein
MGGNPAAALPGCQAGRRWNRGFGLKTQDFAGFILPDLLRASPHPAKTMKKLLLIPLLALACLASSCRTFNPLDPMTMKPSERCSPGQVETGYSAK